MDEIDKRVRRSSLRLVAVSVALGFLIGLAVGLTIGYKYGDRVIVVPLGQGVKV